MRSLSIAALAALPWLASCAPPDFPEDRVFADSGTLTIPPIAPIDDILAAVGPNAGETTATDLQARGDRLRTRADALRRADP